MDTAATVWETAPSGTKIAFKIAMNELNDQAPNDEFLIYEATVDGSGNFTIDVPTNSDGVNVEIIPDDFIYDKKMFTYEYPSWISDGTERTVYSIGSWNVTVTTNKNEVQDFDY